MKLLILMLIVILVMSIAFAGIKNPYIVLTMLFISCIFGILSVAFGIKNIRNAGKLCPCEGEGK